MEYMLDTNICINIMKHHPKCMQDRLRKIPADSIGISIVVLAELWHGIYHSKQMRRNVKALRDFLKFIIIEDWPKNSLDLYRKLRMQLKPVESVIGDRDLYIATHALYLDVKLVTDNIRGFKYVSGLKIENWM